MSCLSFYIGLYLDQLILKKYTVRCDSFNPLLREEKIKFNAFVVFLCNFRYYILMDNWVKPPKARVENCSALLQHVGFSDYAFGKTKVRKENKDPFLIY